MTGDHRPKDLAYHASGDFRLYLENSPHGFFLVDGKGDYLLVNGAACETTGYTQEELMGMNLIDVIYPDDRSIAADHFAMVVRDGRSAGEVRFITKSGEVRFWEVKAVKISDDRFAGFTTDTTERHIAEQGLLERNDELQAAFEELASSEEELKKQYQEIYEANQEIAERERQYRLLFQSSDEGIALHEIIVDEQNRPVDYRFIEVNHAFERITGLLSKDIIGRTVREVLPNTESFWIERYGEVALTGKIIHFNEFSSELGRYYEVTAYSPEPGRFATLVRDISEQKMYEIQLKETNSFLENLITYASVPVIVWGPDLLITRINKAFEELSGRPSPEIIGKPLSILFPPYEVERSLRLIRTTLDGVRWETVEMPILHSDGSIRLVVWNSSTIYDSEGNIPVATIAQGRDITTERFLEKEKDEAAAQIQENIAKLAVLNDSIRNPLSVITTYADMADNPRLTDIIYEEISRIDEMVSNLDREWVASEKILEYLRKHDQVQLHNGRMCDEICPPHGRGDLHTSSLMENRNLFIEELQAQLFTILDSIDALVYAIDMESYEFLFINREGRYLFGDPAGKKCYEWLQQGMDTPCPFCTNPYLVDHGEPTGVYKWEFYNPKINRWLDCRDRAIRWTDGRLVRLEIATDITDRKKSEEALKKSEERFRTLVNSIQETMSVITRDGTFLFANMHAAKNLSGSDASNVIGRNIRDFVSPEKAEELQQNYQTTIDSGVPFIDEVLVEMQGVPRYFFNRLFPIQFEDRGDTVVLSLSLDVTRQHEIQQSLMKSEERYRRIVDTAEEGIWQTDSLLKIVYVNQKIADLLGYPLDEMKGRSIYSFIPKEDISLQKDRMVKRRHGENDRYEQRIIKKDGTVLWFFVSATAILNPDGSFGGSVAMFSDITERKLAEEQLREKTEELERYFNSSLDLICIADTKGYFLKLNPEWEAALGYPASELEGTRFFDLVHPDDLKRTIEAITDLDSQTTILNFVNRYRHKDGTYRWIEWRSFPHGNRIYSSARDITHRKLAEEQLLMSEERFRELFNNMRSAVAVYRVSDDGEDFIISDFNLAAEKIEQVKKADIIGRSVVEVFPGVINFGLFDLFRQVYKTGIPVVHPVTWYQDERIAGWRDNFVFRLPSGEIVAIYEDVTEERRSEEELRDLSQSLTDAMHLAKMAPWEYDIQSGMFTFNDAFYAMLGVTTETAGGYRMSVEDFSSRYTAPAYRDQVFETINLAFSSQEKTFELTIEGELKHTDGRYIWVSTWFRIERDAAGEIIRLHGVNQDITNRKEVEAALRESEQEYRDLADSISDIFFAMDKDLRYIFWNKASEEATGISAQQALGRTIYDLFPGEAGEKTGEIYREVLQTQKAKSFLSPFYLNGRDYIFEINVYPSERGLAVIAKDITERKMIEDALKESTQKILLLTRITRHDIFNELCAVRLIHDLMVDSEDVQETADLINRSLDSIKRIEQVINFTREYDDFGIAASGWININLVITLAQEEVADGGISIGVAIDRSLEVYSDPIIRKVFSTLIENAIRHGGQLSFIRFSAHERSGDLIITGEDDGIGIPDDEKEAIFRYGYGKHTGIGLFIATEILSITGLSIRECGVFGEGARFEIRVPAGRWRYGSR